MHTGKVRISNEKIGRYYETKLRIRTARICRKITSAKPSFDKNQSCKKGNKK